MKKLIFALIVVVALLVIAMPVAAQGPNPYQFFWYNRTPESQLQTVPADAAAIKYKTTTTSTLQLNKWMQAGGDPFGGWPRVGVEMSYNFDKAAGTVVPKGVNAAWPYTGIVAKFGLQPWNVSKPGEAYLPGSAFAQEALLAGGVPSNASGDGSGPRKAVYIGGAWADASRVPVGNFCVDYRPDIQPPASCRETNQTPYELPACATVAIPAGTSKWFKLDTWKKDNAGRGLKTQIWLDDERDLNPNEQALNAAGVMTYTAAALLDQKVFDDPRLAVASGKALFGAANKYFWGTAPADGWSGNIYWGANAMDPNEINGYFMIVYDPDVLQPNHAFAPPNATIFTVDVSGSGSLRRSCTAAAFAGQPCVPASKGGPSTNTGNSVSGMIGQQDKIRGATFNPNQPSHLLWTEGTYDGWVFVRVWNQMIWDGRATVCSFRDLK